MHTEWEIDKATCRATNEAIVRSLVGIAVRDNRNIGTGTLVSFRDEWFVLTAEHVVKGAHTSELRFFIPPSTSLVEHSMRDGIPKDFAFPSAGDILKLSRRPFSDSANDVIAMPLAPTPLIPDYMKAFRIEKAVDAISDGASVLVIGFPVDNSTLHREVPGHRWMALGLTSEHARYFELQQTAFTLHSSFQNQRHFVFEYTRENGGITPPGFSGGGAWCVANVTTTVWTPQPVLVGVVTSWHKKNANHPDLLQVTRASIIKKLFEANV